MKKESLTFPVKLPCFHGLSFFWQYLLPSFSVSYSDSTASRMIATALSQSSFVTISGGIIRMICAPMAVIRSFLLIHSCFTSTPEMLSSNSTPTSNPCPLASFTCGRVFSCSMKYAPTSFAFPARSRSRSSFTSA